MTKNRGRTLLGILRTLLAAGLIGGGGVEAQEADSENGEIAELSPFTVVAEDDQGYQATTTLAGSRVRSNIRDLGASISVVTSEFLDDTGATDSQSLLVYTGNTEVGGALGNFSDASLSGGRPTANDSRVNPQFSQRIRGLVRAELTRDYFQTNIPFDSYNTSRVTINRGPNSILFGLGSPGGVINHSLKRAHIGSDNTEVSLRIDQRGGHREVVHLSRTLLEDRMAIRIDGLNEKKEFKQEPAFEEDRRVFTAFDLTLLKNDDSWLMGKTSIRGNFELGEILRNPPDVIPPTDAFSSWFTGYRDPLALLRVPGITMDTLRSDGLTPEDVRAAVESGLAEVPEGMTLDEFASTKGQFVPKTIVDRFTGEGVGNTHTINPIFLYPALNHNSGTAAAGYDDPGLSGLSGIMHRWRPDGLPRQDTFWSAGIIRNLPGFASHTLQDRRIFDYHDRLLQGTSNEVDTDFDMYQLAIEQALFDGNAGFEIAFDRQNREQRSFTPFSTGPRNHSKDIYIDITRHQPPGDTDGDGVGDSFINENLGRVAVRWNDPITDYRKDEQETVRATVFGTVDMRNFLGDTWGGLLGSHTVTGLYEERQSDFFLRRTRPIWGDSLTGPPPGSSFILNGPNNHGRRYVRSLVYLGPSMLEATDPSQVRIDDTVNVEFPQPGDVHSIMYFDNRPEIDGPAVDDWVIQDVFLVGNLGRDDLESKAVSVQNRILDDHLVTLFAWREDSLEAYQRRQHDITFPDPNNPDLVPLRTEEGEFNEDLLVLEDEPASISEDSTFTWSAVGYFPEKYLFELPMGMDLSGHYYEAESFQPAGISNNILGEEIPSPRGETTEYGFTVEFRDNGLSLRVNWFETRNANSRTNLGGTLNNIVGNIDFWLGRIIEAEDSGLDFSETDADLIGVSSYDEYYDALINLLPPNVQSVYNFRVVEVPNPDDGTISHVVENDPVQGINSTLDFVSEGIEIDLVGRLTKNLSIAFNVAKQETIQSNVGPVAAPLALQIEQNLIDRGFAEAMDSPFQMEPSTYLTRIKLNTTSTIRSELAREGTVSQEQRKWRANLTTRYDFTDGFMDGFSLGGAIRYQDGVAVGYPFVLNEDGNQVPDVANPFLGPDEWNGDLFFRYRRPLFEDKVDWTIQFNARNLYRGGNDDIPVVVNPDGALAVVRIPTERQFFLTNTFSF